MQSRQPQPLSVALFGGSFDPVHLGHVAIANAAKCRLGLDRVVFIPCRQSPHKGASDPAPACHRLAMLELAVASRPWAEISTFELDRPPPSWSWQTAEHFAHTTPAGTRLFWLLGADQWAALDSWARPARLAELVHFIVFPRGNIKVNRRPGFSHTLINVRHPASATTIRSAIANGRPIDGLVPAPVRDYIVKHRLYRPRNRPSPGEAPPVA
jgi:nicotinate-nucleotide adenylyltransferase